MSCGVIGVCHNLSLIVNIHCTCTNVVVVICMAVCVCVCVCACTCMCDIKTRRHYGVLTVTMQGVLA